MDYFDGIKKGNKIYDLFTGKFVEVANVDKTGPYHIKIYDGHSCNMDGCEYIVKPQRYFQDKPEIIAPPRPNRKVKKVIEFYVNIYRNSIGEYIIGASTYDTHDKAICASTCGAVATGVKFTSEEFEVEE